MADPRLNNEGMHARSLSVQEVAALDEKPNLCPFGCSSEQLDAHGYCRHLIGFSNDGKLVELRERIPQATSYERTGDLVGEVRTTDQLVRVPNYASRTMSNTLRVYRKDGKGAILARPDDARRRSRPLYEYDEDDKDVDESDVTDDAELEALTRPTTAPNSLPAA